MSSADGEQGEGLSAAISTRIGRVCSGRGVGIGSTAHVGGMAALIAAGEHAAADAAAVALVVVGVARSVLIQVPSFTRALSAACGEVPPAVG